MLHLFEDFQIKNSVVYRVSQKFVPLLYKSVFQYDWTCGKQFIETKLVSFNLIHIFILVVPSFDSNIRFVYIRAKGARARVYFAAT